MQYPHRIRLRGPWEFEVLSAEGNRQPTMTGRVQWPCDVGQALGASFHGRVRLRRFFNRPTGLEANEAIWLIVEGSGSLGEISLNGESLRPLESTGQPVSFDVTQRLEPRNEIGLEVEWQGLPGDLLGEVRLEIRPK